MYVSPRSLAPIVRNLRDVFHLRVGQRYLIDEQAPLPLQRANTLLLTRRATTDRREDDSPIEGSLEG